MNPLVEKIRTFRTVAVATVLLVLVVFLPQHAYACVLTYEDGYADETTVHVWNGLIDYYSYNYPGYECNPGTPDFLHEYHVELSIQSPSGRTVAASNYSSAWGGGGSVEAWADILILNEAGSFNFLTSARVFCSVLATFVFQGGGGGGVAVPPKINGSNVVWYFNGVANPTCCPTAITLVASAGPVQLWNVLVGANLVSLTSLSEDTAGVTSNGSAFSSSVGDIYITARVNGVTSAPFRLTSRAPYKLVHTGTVRTCGLVETLPGVGTVTWTYHSAVNYDIKDTLDDPLPPSGPSGLGVNEQFGIEYDDIPNDWGRQEGSTLILGSSFFDKIAVAGPRTPSATCDGSGVAVDHWAQLWRIGSATVGQGRGVQTNTLQRYTNLALHTSPITSPLP